MKGIDTLIASAVIIIISISAVFLALELSKPSTERSQEILLMQEGENTLSSIDNAVRTVLSEGEGSVRVLKFSITGGNYKIDNQTDAVTFSMDSKAQIVAFGVSKTENGINIIGGSAMVYLNLSYENFIDVKGNEEFGRGYHSLTIRNDGYNSTTQKQMITITTVPIAPTTLITFTDQYNQVQTLVLKGTTLSNPNNLNDLGINTYNITEALESGGQFNYFQSSTKNLTGFNTTSADYTNSLDSQNYNVTSTVGQSGGIKVDKYNQTQTAAVVGTALTSPDNLNAIDGQTYNVTESIAYTNTPTYYINFTETLRTSASTTYTEALSLTWTPESGSRYLVLAYAEGNESSTSYQELVRIMNNSLLLGAYADRPKVANTERMPYMFGIIQNGAGTPVKYNISFATSNAAGTAGIIRAKLMAIRIDNLNYTQFNSTYINSETANVNNVWGDAAGDTDEITITPSKPGWYLILTYAKVESDSTTNAMAYRINLDNGQEYIPYGIGTLAGNFNYSLVSEQNTAEELSWGTSAVRYLTATTHSIKTQIVTTSGTTADWQYRSLIAIRLTDVFNFLNSTTTTQASWSTNTNFQNYTVLNLNNNPGTYLMLAGISIQGSSTSYSYSNQLVIDGTSYTLITESPQIAADYRARSFWQNITFNSNPHYVATQYSTSNTGGIVRVKNSDILALPLSVSNFYRVEVEHNATSVTWSGILNSINVSINFTINDTSILNLTIYNFNSGSWDYTPCQNGAVIANTWYNWWCNITGNPAYYNSSDGKIKVRLNGTTNILLGLLREDYIQFYVGYTTTPTYANISVEHNSSTISENPSSITKINVTTLLKTNASSGISFRLYIYNFSSGSWYQCYQATINMAYYKMECVFTSNTSYYISNGIIRVRLNSSGDITTHQMMEDYLVYQITTPANYRAEVEHNATTVSYSGTLNNISIALNLSTNVTSNFDFLIYNFNSGNWDLPCYSFSPTINNWNMIWCNKTLNPDYYLSSGIISIRLNETSHQNLAEIKEDYVQYYVTYTA